MVVVQKRSKRKVTGGRYRKLIKRLANIGRLPTFTKIGERAVREKRSRGGNPRKRLYYCQEINVVDLSTKKCKKTKIKSVLETPANRHLVRRNILTKGAIVDTDLGKVKITSRPGQEPTINGTLIK